MGIPMDIVYVPDEYGNLIQTRVPTAIGFPTWFAGPEVPEGYLYCDGSEVNREVYKELFTAIGTTWGAGDGVDTFNLPDLRGIFVRGDGGENNAALGVRQSDAIRNITGAFSIRSWGDSGDGETSDAGWPIQRATGPFGPSFTNNDLQILPIQSLNTKNVPVQTIPFDVSRVVATAAENRPINVALKPCIRYV